MADTAGAAAKDDAWFMLLAREQALVAQGRGEVPVGCVVSDAGGRVVAAGSNRTTERGNATAHAEMVALEELARPQPRRALTFHVTCEPCVMCAAAIVATGVASRIVFGCSNPRFGGCGSVRGLSDYAAGGADEALPEVVGGVGAGEAIALLEEFYVQTNPNAPVPHARKKRRRVGGPSEQ
jgi:tRNA-specific adenosine deaminase 2